MRRQGITVVLLGFTALVFLASGCVNPGKVKQLEDEAAMLHRMIAQKDAQIQTLTGQAKATQDELEGIKKNYDLSQKELEGVKKELENAKKESAGAISNLDTPVVNPQSSTNN